MRNSDIICVFGGFCFGFLSGAPCGCLGGLLGFGRSPPNALLVGSGKGLVKQDGVVAVEHVVFGYGEGATCGVFANIVVHGEAEALRHALLGVGKLQPRGYGKHNAEATA